MTIKNIVFDVGNVLVRWDPLSITHHVFGQNESALQLMQAIFKSQTWLDLNLGIINESEAIERYQQALNIEVARLEYLLQVVKESLSPISDSVALLERLHHKQFELYALTDNTHAIMAYLKKRYHYWPLFKGIVVSAEVGHLKPSPQIYHYLLDNYQLKASETVFIDDVKQNVEGAKAVGIQAIQFTNTEQCILDLKDLHIDAQ